MYQVNEEKVTIVGHSMGGPVTLYFLNNVVSQDWKDEYINAFIPLSGAWSGANMVLPILISGLQSLIPDIPIISDYLEQLNPAFDSMESMLWLLPHPSVYGHKPLVTTTERGYSPQQYEVLFQDIGKPNHYTRFQSVLAINGEYAAPNVPVYCFYGIDVPTFETFHYGSRFPDGKPDIKNGDGDGQVNRISLDVCLRWSQQDAFFLHIRPFPLLGISK